MTKDELRKWVIKKLKKAGITYTSHNNNAHFKINDNAHVYPTTGSYIFFDTHKKGNNHYEDEAKANIKEFIQLMTNPMGKTPAVITDDTYVPWCVEFHYPDGRVERIRP